MGYWVLLSTEWALEDLQAGLSIVIQVICVSGIFIASQYFWQNHALRIARGQRVPVARILSINSPGDVWDSVCLLRLRIFSYQSTAIQCLLVVVLGLMALFSGPIARFSTHRGVRLPERVVDGRLASRSTSCILDDVVGTQRIWDRLDQARFPKDQLLDHLPDLAVDWQYAEKDWNSTWTADCRYTNKTEIQLTGTGVSNGTDLPQLWYQFEDLWELVPSFKTNWTYIDTDNQGTTRNGSFEDATLWINVVDLSSPMRMALLVVYMDHPPSQANDDGVDFGKGPAPATYTKVECDLDRRKETYYQAQPDLVLDETCVVSNLRSHFFQGVLERDLNGVGGHLPSGDNIFRWFQSYMISKDIKTPMPVERGISVRVGTVEVSATFFAIASVMVLVILIGFARYVYVLWRYGEVVKKVPETKADWVLHAVGGKGLESLYGMGVGTWLEMKRERYMKVPEVERGAEGFQW